MSTNSKSECYVRLVTMLYDNFQGGGDSFPHLEVIQLYTASKNCASLIPALMALHTKLDPLAVLS
jgi:hypothetical protein